MQPGTLVGGWNFKSDPKGQPTEVVVFLPDGTYLQAQANPPAPHTSIDDPLNGIEQGTYSWDLNTGTITVRPAIDTNGDGGFSSLSAGATVHLSPDQTGLVLQDRGETTVAARITEVRLMANSTAEGIELTWPSHLTDYTVQAITDPASTQWNTVPGIPVIESGLYKLRVTPVQQVTLFRLFKP